MSKPGADAQSRISRRRQYVLRAFWDDFKDYQDVYSEEDGLDVKTVTADDEATVIETVVLAFAADPATRWAWPHSHQYLAAMPKFVRAFGGNAFAHAICTPEYTGAALWLPPGVHPDEERLGELLESTASPSARDEGSAIFEQMAKYHPTEPHWYLPLMAWIPRIKAKVTAMR